MTPQSFVFRNRIREVLVKKNLTEADLARILDSEEAAIEDIEKGKLIPSARMALAMCMALNCDFEDLFYAANPVSATIRDY